MWLPHQKWWDYTKVFKCSNMTYTRTWMQTWKMTKQRGDFVCAVFSWWFSLAAKSLLLSWLCYTETIVQKSGVCSAIRSLSLGSTSQLLNPIKYPPFSTKHYTMWLLSQLKMLWKEKRESYIMQHVEKTILLLSLFDVTKPQSHNKMMHRTMSGSQPSITGCGRAGPFIVFIFTQSL